MAERKVIVFISMSLDGFIATKNDELDWLSVVEKEGEDYGYNLIRERVDTYIVGRVTYDTVLKLTGGSFPQNKWFDCYVITRGENRKENGVTFYNGNIGQLIN